MQGPENMQSFVSNALTSSLNNFERCASSRHAGSCLPLKFPRKKLPYWNTPFSTIFTSSIHSLWSSCWVSCRTPADKMLKAQAVVQNAVTSTQTLLSGQPALPNQSPCSLCYNYVLIGCNKQQLFWDILMPSRYDICTASLRNMTVPTEQCETCQSGTSGVHVCSFLFLTSILERISASFWARIMLHKTSVFVACKSDMKRRPDPRTSFERLQVQLQAY